MGCVARFGMRPWTSTTVQRTTRAPHPPAVRRRLPNAVLRTGSEWRLHCWGGRWPEEEGDMVHGLNRMRMQSCLWQAFKGAWAGQEPGCLNFSKTSLWIVCGWPRLRWWPWWVVGFGGGGSGQSQLSLQGGPWSASGAPVLSTFQAPDDRRGPGIPWVCGLQRLPLPDSGIAVHIPALCALRVDGLWLNAGV